MDITDEKAVPLTKQLMDDYERTHASTIAVMPVPHDGICLWVIAPQGEGKDGLYSVETFVENQRQRMLLATLLSSDATSSHLKSSKSSKPSSRCGNEIQLTDAIDTLNKTQRVFAREFKGARYDVGDKFGFMKTSIDYALKHPQVKDDLKTTSSNSEKS